MRKEKAKPEKRGPKKKTPSSETGKKKSKYQTNVEPMLEQIRAWAAKGLSYEEISGNLHIDAKTLRAYRQRFEPLREALEYGNGKATAAVENALWKNAVGYEYVEEEVVRVNNELGYAVVPVRKWKPADVRAQALWLTNRAKADWKNKPEDDSADRNAEVKVSFGVAEEWMRPPGDGNRNGG